MLLPRHGGVPRLAVSSIMSSLEIFELSIILEYKVDSVRLIPEATPSLAMIGFLNLIASRSPPENPLNLSTSVSIASLYASGSFDMASTDLDTVSCSLSLGTSDETEGCFRLKKDKKVVVSCLGIK